ncbi:COP9 signalosome complex subunit 7b isoform X8 [Macaca nemestrina]
MKCIPYSVLLKDLEMRNLRELEDLIIEAVYTDIIQGKLDQRNQLLEVDFCIGRDIRKKDINNIVKTLHEWCDGCEAVLLGIEQQVLRANQYKENHNRTQQQVEAEVTNIKKTLKATASSSAQEMEQQLAERECPPHAEQRQPTKKMSKVKDSSASVLTSSGRKRRLSFHAYLGDTVDLVPDHCNKANSVVKVLLCHPGWSAMVQSQLTEISASRVQVTLLPQSPK